jgi:hypothetical protein
MRTAPAARSSGVPASALLSLARPNAAVPGDLEIVALNAFVGVARPPG